MARGQTHSDAAGLEWAEAYSKTGSIYAVSELFGAHPQTILHRLKALGIPIRGCTRHSLEELQEVARGRGGECLSTTFRSVADRFRFRCSGGHGWESRGNSFLAGNWCRKCADKAMEYALGDLQSKAAEYKGECLSDEYRGSLEKHTWKCSEGHVWEAIWSNILLGTWCPECAQKSQLRTDGLEWIRGMAVRLGGECISPEYLGRHHKHTFRCSRGHEWETTPGGMALQDSWCPHCANQHSKAELAIFAAVAERFQDALSGTKGVLPTKRFELDVYVPSLRKAVEYDGVWYHSSEASHKRDARKDLECQQVGIKLLRVPEAEYEADRPGTIKKVLDFLTAPM